MDDPKQQDDRWRELADLLGLPPEKSTGKAASSAPPPRVELAPPPVAPTAKIEPPEPPPPVRMEPEMPSVAQVPDEPTAAWETEFDDDQDDGDDSVAEQHEPVFEDSVEAEDRPAESVPSVPVAEGEEKPRGRRRRRRGRRRGGADRAEGEARDPNAPPTPVEPRVERKESPDRPPRGTDSESREGRGRGRHRGGRRDDEAPRRPAPPVQHRDDLEPLEAEEHDDTPPRKMEPISTEDTDFSNWNVPSWQDLISSLYRPDR